MRGRNSNRKGPNPLTRAYESNGPDVKIRGTAHHIAEKYLQLARDAQSSGDTVAAESYLQHAEHYFRLIAAAQQAQQQAQFGFQRPPGEAAETEEADDEEDFAGLPDRFASPLDRGQQPSPQSPQNYAGGPQPYQDRPPYNGERQPGGPHGGSNQHSGDRPERAERGPRPERPYNDRNYQDRSGQSGRNRDGRRDRPQYRDEYRGERTESAEPRPVREATPRDNPADVEQPVNGLPAFITAPVRIPAAEPEIIETAPEIGASETPSSEGHEETGRFPLRSRRRRRGRPEGEGNDSGISESPSEGDEVPASK
jgi:hypothetical protein